MSDTDNNVQLENNKYQIKINAFEGPFDLLLHLVRTSEINVYDISIAEITRQYLAYLSLMVFLNLDNITEFVEMATTLILIKSRSLLPIEIDYDEEKDDSRMELIAKLLEYQKYKIAAGVLEEISEDNVPIVSRNTETKLFQLDETEESNWKQLSVLDLIGAFAEVLNKNHSNNFQLDIFLHNFTVEDKVKFINDILFDKESFNYFELIKENMTKMEIVCTFLALLELVKKGMVAVRQHIIFGDIHIVKLKNLG